MNPFLSTKSDDKKINPSQILGGIMGGFDELGFENEVSLSSVSKGVGGIFKDLVSLGTDIAGIEDKKSGSENNKFPSQGSIEFKKQEAQAQQEIKVIKEANEKRAFFQTLKEDVARVESARDKMIYEEEIADIGAHISTEEKNSMLHYQASYKDRSIYQMAELRRKMIEQKKNSDKDKKQASMAQTQTKGKSAMQGAFEGSSGAQGGGMANLSSASGGVG